MKFDQLILISVALIGFAVFVALLISIPVFLLWNWLIPEIFGLKEITYLQAIGLSILSSLLFKSTNSQSKN